MQPSFPSSNAQEQKQTQIWTVQGDLTLRFKKLIIVILYSLNNREAAMLSRENVNAKIRNKEQYWVGTVRNKY